ncbi:MAG: hypothetical protein BJ554DRAFT_1271 [Olpidium bornovanus]|uniref:Uncharacterized protein n=1 Tax=Olpidium bornovanus TaxID=278681 RepID=A0A8H7ZSL4_9FUNG|nr:MAG: hypothetical protein BJ554DRAFT_1271 [Olpidium bornovanus]
MVGAVQAREITTGGTQSATVVSRELTPENAAAAAAGVDALPQQENGLPAIVLDNQKVGGCARRLARAEQRVFAPLGKRQADAEWTFENQRKVLRFLLSNLEHAGPQSRPATCAAAGDRDAGGTGGGSPASSAGGQLGGRIKLRPLTVPMRFTEGALAALPPELPPPPLPPPSSGRGSAALSPFPTKGDAASDNLRAIRRLCLSGKARRAGSRRRSGTAAAAAAIIPHARAEGELRPVTAGREDRAAGAARTIAVRSVGVQTRSALEENTQILLSRVRSEVRAWGNPPPAPPPVAKVRSADVESVARRPRARGAGTRALVPVLPPAAAALRACLTPAGARDARRYSYSFNQSFQL